MVIIATYDENDRTFRIGQIGEVETTAYEDAEIITVNTLPGKYEIVVGTDYGLNVHALVDVFELFPAKEEGE